jgi:hypothetical protein
VDNYKNNKKNRLPLAHKAKKFWDEKKKSNEREQKNCERINGERVDSLVLCV